MLSLIISEGMVSLKRARSLRMLRRGVLFSVVILVIPAVLYLLDSRPGKLLVALRWVRAKLGMRYSVSDRLQQLDEVARRLLPVLTAQGLPYPPIDLGVPHMLLRR